MDAAGTDRAFIFGYSEGANLAALFGATYPERTRGLLLWGAQARWTRADDYPWGLTRAEYDREIAYLAENGATLEYLTGWGAGSPKDLPYVKFFMRYLKASASPAALAALERLCSSIDMRDILPAVRVPTVVMNRTGDPVANIEAARDVAARIPGARFVEFPGDTHPFFAGPAVDEALTEIETFITGCGFRLAWSASWRPCYSPTSSDRPRKPWHSATDDGEIFSKRTTVSSDEHWIDSRVERSTLLETVSWPCSTGQVVLLPAPPQSPRR
jgi:acetyl esterase/lipase